jgi:hypothetical protein
MSPWALISLRISSITLRHSRIKRYRLGAMCILVDVFMVDTIIKPSSAASFSGRNACTIMVHPTEFSWSIAVLAATLLSTCCRFEFNGVPKALAHKLNILQELTASSVLDPAIDLKA